MEVVPGGLETQPRHFPQRQSSSPPRLRSFQASTFFFGIAGGRLRHQGLDTQTAAPRSPCKSSSFT